MPTSKRYHHGDLRGELVRLGLASLEEHGSEGLSLRALAQRAGVSKTAPYRHFTDRNALLAAMAEEGFRELTEALEAGRDRGVEAEGDALPEMGAAYLQFAVERPQLYRLMFSPILECIPDDEVYWARRALGTLAEIVAGKAVPDPDSTDAVAAAWGYIHGVVMLRLDGLYPPHLMQPNWGELARLVPRLPRVRRTSSTRQ